MIDQSTTDIQAILKYVAVLVLFSFFGLNFFIADGILSQILIYQFIGTLLIVVVLMLPEMKQSYAEYNQILKPLV